MAEDAAFHKRIDDLRDDMTRSIDVLRSEINTRFAEISARLDERFTSTDRRIDDTNRRIDDTNRRIDDLHHALSRQNTYMTIWFTILSLLVVLFGFFK